MTPERYKEITELNEKEQEHALECIRAGKHIIQTRHVTYEELEELRTTNPNHWVARATVSWVQRAEVRRFIA